MTIAASPSAARNSDGPLGFGRLHTAAGNQRPAHPHAEADVNCIADGKTVLTDRGKDLWMDRRGGQLCQAIDRQPRLIPGCRDCRL